MENLEQTTVSAVTDDSVKTDDFGMSFLRILSRHIILILILFILGGAIGTAYAKLTVKETWTATAQYSLLVSINDEEVEEKGRLVDYNTTITKMTMDKIMGVFPSLPRDSGITSVSVKYDTDITIFSVSCTGLSENAVKEALPKIVDEARKRLNDKTGNDMIVTAHSVEFSELFNDYKTGVVTTSSYSITKFIILGFVIGLVAGVLTACLIYLFNNKLKDGRELEHLTNTVVLAYIDK